MIHRQRFRLKMGGFLSIAIFIITCTAIAFATDDIIQIERDYGLQLGKGKVSKILLDDTNSRIILSWTGNVMEFFELGTGKSSKIIPISSRIGEVILSPDDKYLAVIASDSAIIIDCKEMEIVREIQCRGIGTGIYLINSNDENSSISNGRLYFYNRTVGELSILDIIEGQTIVRLKLQDGKTKTPISFPEMVPWIIDREGCKLLHLKTDGIYEYDLMIDKPAGIRIKPLPSDFYSLSAVQLIAYYSSQGKLIYRRGAEVFRYDIKRELSKKIFSFRFPIKHSIQVIVKKSGNYLVISKQLGLPPVPFMKLLIEGKPTDETYIYDVISDKMSISEFLDEVGSGYFARDGRIYNSYFVFNPTDNRIRNYKDLSKFISIHPGSFDVSRNGKLIVGKRGDCINVYNLEYSRLLLAIETGDYREFGRFSAGADRLLSFISKTELIFYDRTSGKFSTDQTPFGTNILQISDDFSTILSTPQMSQLKDTTKIIASAKKGGYQKEQEIELFVDGIALSPDGKSFVVKSPVESGKSKLTVYQKKNGLFEKEREMPASIPSGSRIFRFIDEGNIIFCPDVYPEEIYRISLKNEHTESIRIYKTAADFQDPHRWAISDASCSKPALLSLSFFFGDLRVWDMEKAKLILYKSRADKSYRFRQITSMAFSPDGRMMAVLGNFEYIKNVYSNVIEIYDVKNKFKLIKTIKTDSAWELVSFSPDNKILSAKGDGYVILFDIEKAVNRLKVHYNEQ